MAIDECNSILHNTGGGGGGGGSEPRIICIWLSSHSKVNPKQNYRLNPKAPDVKKYLKKE